MLYCDRCGDGFEAAFGAPTTADLGRTAKPWAKSVFKWIGDCEYCGAARVPVQGLLPAEARLLAP